jgi:molecular chaperone DnaK
MARDNWELGKFGIEFAPGPRGSARVGVQFSIDADGILAVLARDTATGTDKVLEIDSAAIDVDDARVEAMLSDSVEHAWADMNERQWTEAELKAKELLDGVAAALPLAGDALETAERDAVEAAAQAVREALAQRDLPGLKQANRRLDAVTEPLAAILVERAMEAAMQRQGLL